MRDNVPCWDLCGGWPGKPQPYGGLYEPRKFMDFIPHAAAQYASLNDDDEFWFEADFFPGREDSDEGLPLYRLVEVNENHEPVPGDPVEGCEFEMQESTIGRLWEFQKAVNAVRYRTGLRTGMAQSGGLDRMFRLSGDKGDPDVLALKLANAFEMDGTATVAGLWEHVTTEMQKAFRIRQFITELWVALTRADVNAADAYIKLNTEQPPFPERFYATLGNQLVEAAVVIEAFNRLTRGGGTGSAEPFHLLGPLEQLRIGLANMEALGG